MNSNKNYSLNIMIRPSLWMVAALLLMGFISRGAAENDFQHQELNQWLDYLHENDRFMGSITLRQSDEIIYEYQAGQLSLEKEADISPETQFRVGSVNKMFTAVLIMQLGADDRLSLDDPLADYFSELPRAGQITLEQLLRHRSGLFNYTSANDFTEWMTEPRSRDALMRRISDGSPVFKPGERADYSNANYLLLGYIIEDVTGLPYAEVLREQILEPLELENTVFGRNISPSLGDARSYRYSEVEQKWKSVPEAHHSVIHSAGALISTPTDLTKFARALFAGKLIGKQYLDQMTELQDGFGRGLIAFLDDEQEIQGYGHYGGIDAYRSNLIYYPETDLSLSITASALRISDSRIRDAILKAWSGKQPEFPELHSVELTENHLQNLTGEYESDDLPMDMTIGVDGGRLTVRTDHQTAFHLTASDKHVFHLEEAGAMIEFEQSENDTYNRFIYHQDGVEFIFIRK